MPSYSAVVTCTTGTNKTAGTITGSTTVRGGLYQINIGHPGTPANVGLEYRVLRTTAAGTNTAYTPNNIDPTNPTAAGMVAGNNHSVEPTYTANSELLVLDVNQLAQGFWQAFSETKKLWSTLAATNGLGLRCIQANGGAPVSTGNWLWEE